MADARAANPIKHLLVGTDFSDNARAALDWAIRIARPLAARVTLVHVIENIPKDGLPAELTGKVEENLATLEEVVRRAGLEAASTWRTGKAWEVIDEVAGRSSADLIVVGARGHTIYSPALIGSTPDRVLRTASAPVVTVHNEDMADTGPIRTIVAATDFSEEAELAIGVAAALLRPAGAKGKLVLVHGWQPLVEYGAPMFGVLPSEFDSTVEEARAALEAVAAQFKDEPFSLESIVSEGYPASVVEREAVHHQADLIALGTHGRTGLGRFLLGSIAERIVHHASRPVLTVRHSPPGERPGASITETVASAPGS